MFAVLEAGGKQHRVQEGDYLKVERMNTAEDVQVEFDRVLMISDADGLHVGAPYLDGAKVTASLIEEARGRKLRVIKFKRRKNYLRRKGHRQPYSLVRIESIAKAS